MWFTLQSTSSGSIIYEVADIFLINVYIYIFNNWSIDWCIDVYGVCWILRIVEKNSDWFGFIVSVVEIRDWEKKNDNENESEIGVDVVDVVVVIVVVHASRKW